MTVLYTIGHSVQAQALLIDTLLAYGVEVLGDIRRYPQSRRNPQFNRRAFAEALEMRDIEYYHLETLGGRRDPLPDSPNTAIRDPGIRAYADYMATPEFETALAGLIALSASRVVAVMCAEGLPANCHRSLVADSLVARGLAVQHIVAGELQEHHLSQLARIDEQARVSYPSLL